MNFARVLILISVINFLLPTYFLGQDIEELAKKTKADPLSISGSLNVQASAVETYGISSTQRPPFFFQIRGNLNLRLFDLIDAPLSLSYSPQGNDFNHPFNRQVPFNQLGISPKYKSLTVHLGYRSILISKYSLSGTAFNGVGVEWKPKEIPWEFTALYGRFAKAATDTLFLDQPGVSQFNRNGYAGKVAYKSKSGKYGIHLFQAKDRIGTSVLPLELLQENRPQENLIVGVFLDQRIYKNLNAKLELTRSAFTQDALARNINAEGEDAVFNPLTFLFQPRESSIYSGVIDGSLNWSPKIANFQLAYKRIGSDYLNLGNPFFNNDLEVISIGVARRFFQNKVSVNANVGVQNNNLDDGQIDETRRLAFNTVVTYTPVQRLNFNANYANYTTNTIRLRLNEIDSLSFFQISENINLGSNLRLGEDMQHTLSANYANQIVRDQNDISSALQNASVSFTSFLKTIDLRPSIRLNYIRNRTLIEEEITQGGGVNVGLGKTFFDKKLNTRLSYNETHYFLGDQRTNINRTIRVSSSYKVNASHNFVLSIGWQDRRLALSEDSGELQGNIGYTYNFSKGKLINKTTTLNQ